MTTVKIKITEEHLDRAMKIVPEDKVNACECVFAQAVKDKFPDTYVQVGHSAFIIVKENMHSEFYRANFESITILNRITSKFDNYNREGIRKDLPAYAIFYKV